MIEANKENLEAGYYWYRSDNDAEITFFGDKDGYEMVEVYGPCKNGMMVTLSRGSDNYTIDILSMNGKFFGPIKNPIQQEQDDCDHCSNAITGTSDYVADQMYSTIEHFPNGVSACRMCGKRFDIKE